MEAGASGALSTVELYIGRQASMTEEIVIEIREGLNDGPLLATSDPVSASDVLILPDADWVVFTFDEPAALSVRDVLSIVVPPVSPDGNVDWAWGGTSADRPTDLFPAGQAWGCYSGWRVRHSRLRLCLCRPHWRSDQRRDATADLTRGRRRTDAWRTGSGPVPA